MRMRRILFLVAAALLVACGQTPPTVGVLRNEVGLRRIDAGPSPADVAARPFLAPDALVRVARGDLVGDGASETILALPNGRGVAIRDAAGHTLRQITTAEYLTHFDVVPVSGRQGYLVLYTYPNAEDGGTFRVVTAEGVTIAQWTEKPPPGAFDSAVWNGETALFYLQGDELVIKSLQGELLGRLASPGATVFRQVYVADVVGGELVAVASGSGYTPYHMLCVYSGTKLVYQEIEPEHAFGIEAGERGSGFTVLTRSRKWRYEGS
jgi:hypothetical protein